MPLREEQQSRKWQITINNPIEKSLNHDAIKEKLNQFKSLIYYCMADEMGSSHHTHVFVAFSSAVRFSTIKKRFPEAHIERARGTSEQNRDYITKSGKWENDTKCGTCIPNTFEEFGDMPIEHQGVSDENAMLYDMIKKGCSDFEILEENPSYMKQLNTIGRTRLTVQREAHIKNFRIMTITYIFGSTATGKTRFVMEANGYENVYRITDYKHPFDSYNGQDILVFDEYKEQFKIQALNNLIDGYPCELPCRYANKQACYTQVYIISNFSLKELYVHERLTSPEEYKSWIRRITKVIKFFAKDMCKEYTIDEYLKGNSDMPIAKVNSIKNTATTIEQCDIKDTPFGNS